MFSADPFLEGKKNVSFKLKLEMPLLPSLKVLNTGVRFFPRSK